MAHKKGGFGKILEFIGLVDDEEPREAYENEYDSDQYGRQQSYAPQRNARSQRGSARQDVSPYRSSYEPTRAPRMNRNASSGSRFDAPSGRNPGAQRRNSYGNAENRTVGRYDYTPRNSRFGSLDDNNDRTDEFAAHAQRPASSPRARTVMFTLHNLEDCCDVIDQLIAKNTVVLTMDALDVKLTQRAVDTLSGAVFALQATIRKASEHTYLIAPSGVEVNENYDMEHRF